MTKSHVYNLSDIDMNFPSKEIRWEAPSHAGKQLTSHRKINVHSLLTRHIADKSRENI